MKREEWELWAFIGLLAVLAYQAGNVIQEGSGVTTTGGKLSAAQIAQLARNAGFSGSDLATAVAIALAESGGDPNSLGDVGIGQGSFGLWQISSRYHPEYGPNFESLYDPETNAGAAFAIYQAAGNSFQPWSTYKTGAYAKYSGIAETVTA